MQRGLGEAVRSWGGSAVLGRQRGLGGFPHSLLPWFPPLAIAVVPPMSNCRGFPHERLHQDSALDRYFWTFARGL
ncbi:hypothetical protein [Moorena sp. SIO3H5]|uniref:hypothetical protein n=1 Tax=Moorena sp. SIO3H5 TaxID=2607834 RepID=UPI0013B7295E|nr:hypothetical protein [Moorena sp. SIO3H5]NEO74403.1 hypothetical protein [Moorena sp. SIO3H5]